MELRIVRACERRESAPPGERGSHQHPYVIQLLLLTVMAAGIGVFTLARQRSCRIPDDPQFPHSHIDSASKSCLRYDLRPLSDSRNSSTRGGGVVQVRSIQS